MPTIPQSDLPRPKSWDEFEDIVWDLYARNCKNQDFRLIPAKYTIATTTHLRDATDQQIICEINLRHGCYICYTGDDSYAA